MILNSLEYIKIFIYSIKISYNVKDLFLVKYILANLLYPLSDCSLRNWNCNYTYSYSYNDYNGFSLRACAVAGDILVSLLNPHNQCNLKYYNYNGFSLRAFAVAGIIYK